MKGNSKNIEYVESSHTDPRFVAGGETGLNWVRVGCHLYRLEYPSPLWKVVGETVGDYRRILV